MRIPRLYARSIYVLYHTAESFLLGSSSKALNTTTTASALVRVPNGKNLPSDHLNTHRAHDSNIAETRLGSASPTSANQQLDIEGTDCHNIFFTNQTMNFAASCLDR